MVLTNEFISDKLQPWSKGGERMPYKYRKLRGRIIEKFGSIREFSKSLDISAVSISKKLNGKAGFSQDDMNEWARILDIKIEEYGEYFFS